MGLNRYDWHWPLREWMSTISLLVLYAQSVGLWYITERWYVGAAMLAGVTHLGLFVLSRDNDGDFAHLWVILVGTAIRVPWQINGPRSTYESDFTVNGEPTEAARETRAFIDSNFDPRDYVYTRNREVVFRRKSDAVMFKLACGPFPQAARE